MTSSWKISVQNTPGMLDQKIYLYRETNGPEIEIITWQDGEQIIKRVDPYVLIEKPTFQTSRAHDLDIEQFIGIFVQYSKQKGFRLSNEAENTGKLIATEKHLEDMRTLVFKNKTVKK